MDAKQFEQLIGTMQQAQFQQMRLMQEKHEETIQRLLQCQHQPLTGN